MKKLLRYVEDFSVANYYLQLLRFKRIKFTLRFESVKLLKDFLFNSKRIKRYA